MILCEIQFLAYEPQILKSHFLFSCIFFQEVNNVPRPPSTVPVTFSFSAPMVISSSSAENSTLPSSLALTSNLLHWASWLADSPLLLVSSRGRLHAGRKQAHLCLLIRAPASHMRAPFTWPNYLPKIPCPNTITLWVRTSRYEFGESTFSP